MLRSYTSHFSPSWTISLCTLFVIQNFLSRAIIFCQLEFLLISYYIISSSLFIRPSAPSPTYLFRWYFCNSFLLFHMWSCSCLVFTRAHLNTLVSAELRVYISRYDPTLFIIDAILSKHHNFLEHRTFKV